jgi:hypothetical protein
VFELYIFSFFRLPQDIYQVAKVSKILQLMEKGNAADFKNKSLDEIDIDMENVEYEPDEESRYFNNTSNQNNFFK